MDELSIVTGGERITCETRDVSAKWATAAELPEFANKCLKPGTEYLLCIRVLSGTWYFNEFVFSTPTSYRNEGIFAIPVTTKGALPDTTVCIKTSTADLCVIDYCYLIEGGAATPVDLSGHQLRSLPDGTRDVLTVDGSGAVSVEQATAEITLDGSQEYGVMAMQEGAPNIKFSATSLGVDISWDGMAADSDTGLACDALPPGVSNNEQYGGKIGISRRASGSEGLTMCVPESWGTTVEALKSYLATHPVTVVAALATPQTVQLDPITPPSIPASDATLLAASDVPCDIETSM